MEQNPFHTGRIFSLPAMKTAGITTTVPIECMLAAGYMPVDLNNLFISDLAPAALVDMAEKDGFPLNTCTWIKGMYGACLKHHIDTVVCVTSGDCSNTLMLMEVFKLKGIKTIPFSYPAQPDYHEMKAVLERFSAQTGATLAQAEEMRYRLAPARALAAELDRLTWQDNRISGFENHIWLVSASDFNQDYVKYSAGIDQLIIEAEKRPRFSASMLRLAYIGVPPVFAGYLYSFLEENGARVVYNETQRQFAMAGPGSSLPELYTSYTYPYPVEYRIRDIAQQLAERKIDGIIHYVQSFCHRTIGDIIFRAKLDIPVLTLEGGNDCSLNQHTRTRLEAFVDMLEQRRSVIAK